MDDNDRGRIGARIIALRQALDGFRHETISLDEYESVIVGGRAAALHSELRKLGAVAVTRFDQYRKIADLQRIQSDFVLRVLSDSGFISVEHDASGAIRSISVLRSDQDDSLLTAERVFRASNPSAVALAAISLVDESYKAPLQRDIAIQRACQSCGCSSDIVEQAIADLLQLRAISITEDTIDGQPLLANPQTFQDTIDVGKLLAVFKADVRDRALEVLDKVARHPAVPLSAEDKPIGDLLAEAGLIDYNAVKGHDGKVIVFPTIASIWGMSASADGAIAADAVDDSKAFLTTLRYGELYSDYWRGRIMDQELLLGALIRRGSVGSATAIGQDYPLVVARGIVNVIENPNLPGRFDMELRKPEIAKAVLDVVTGKTKRDKRMPVEVAGISMSEQYFSPEIGRQRVELPKQFREEKQSIVFGLLTIRRRNR